MRFHAFALAGLLVVSPLLAADWPPEFIAYEQIALREPRSGVAFRQMNSYVGASGRIDELKERWKTAATGNGGVRYHVLLGWLMMEARDFATAAGHFQDAIDADATDPAAWEGLGMSLLRDPVRKPQAQAAFEKAIELAAAHGGGGSAALALAESHLASGQTAEAIAILERGPARVQDAADWRSVAQHWAHTAYRLGRLPAEIARLEAAMHAGDARAAALLAQCYVAARDFSLARETLAAARKAQPAAAFLRREALAMAQAMKDTTGAAALLKDEAEAAPTPATRRALFFALVEIGDREGAHALLGKEGASIAASPATWRESVLRLRQLDLARPMAALVEQNLATTDWEGLLTLAELRIAEGDFAGAEVPLWQVLEGRPSEPALSTRALEEGNRPGEARVHASFSGADFSRRRSFFDQYREIPPALFAPDSSRVFTTIRPLATRQDARDHALLYLALIAEKTSRAAEFVGRLEPLVAARPIEERIFAWVAIESPAHLIREAAALATHANSPRAQAFCAEELRLMAEFAQIDDATKAAAKEAAARLPARRPASPAVASKRAGFSRAMTAFTPGKPDYTRAVEQYERTVAELRTAGEEMTELARMAAPMSFAQWIGWPPGPPGFSPSTGEQAAAATLRCLYAPRPETRRSALEFRDALAPVRWPAESYEVITGGPSRPLRREAMPPAERERLVFPPGGLFSWAETGVMWMVFTNVRERRLWRGLKPKIDAEAAALPPERAFQARAAAAWLAWWNGETDDAITRLQKLLAESGDNDVRLGLATMLAKAGKAAEAAVQFREWQPPYPAARRFAQSWQLRLAAEAVDAAGTLALSRELAGEPWEVEDLRGIVQALEKGQAGDLLAEWRVRLAAELAKEQDAARLPAVLRDFDQAGDAAGAVAAAKKILGSFGQAPDPAQRYEFPDRAAALAVLEKFGARAAYAESLAKESAAAPDLVELRLRLAEAESEAGAAAEAWRRVLELQPNHRRALRALLLKAEPGTAAQRDAIERLLTLEPDETLARHSDLLFSCYEKAGKLPRLAEQISQVKFSEGARWGLAGGNADLWKNFAQRFINSGQAEASVLVLRKAVATFDSCPAILQDLLVQQLLALDRRAEAGRALVETLLPAAPAQRVIFARQPPQRSAFYKRPTLHPDTVRTAEKLGAGGELRARLEKAATNLPMKAALAFLRVTARDAAVLSGIPSLGAEFQPPGPRASASDATDVKAWGLPLAKELAGWPEAAAANRQFLQELFRATGSSDRDHGQRFEIAQLLLQAGDRETAVSCAREALAIALRSRSLSECTNGLRLAWLLAVEAGDDPLATECVSTLIARAATGEDSAFQSALACLEPAIQAGRPEAPALLAAVQAKGRSGHAPTGSDNWRQLVACEQQWQLAQGDLRSWIPVAWLDADRSSQEQATIAWDLGPNNAHVKNRLTAPLSGTPLPQFEGKVAIELLFSEDGESMLSLATLAAVGARGIWQGRLPAPAGFVRAVMTEAGGVYFGSSLPVFAGRNLLRRDGEPREFWGFPADFAKVVQGGPALQGSHVAWKYQAPAEVGADTTLVGRRIELRAGCDYFLSGWVRAAPRGSLKHASLGWRTYDRAGQRLGEEFIRAYPDGKRFWHFQGQRLQRPGEGREGAQLPANAVWLEPVIQDGRGGFDLAGLSLVEIPPAPVSQ
jgi:tetratricopeptide (TPR) repeat protein